MNGSDSLTRLKMVLLSMERVLLDRDGVISKTWYNEEKNRWEMDPIAVSYAVSKKLAEHARIRHDWGAMYIALKADDKEFYVDIDEFDMLFEDFGGFDGLYMKMLAQEWMLEKMRNINDDIMMVIVFPVAEFIIPYPLWSSVTGDCN
ncbi:probable inactive ATP-dependent zinc metalloprotease FTSHI 5, chloroplastic [Mercurialis annua]|uniref:probable inactive ATP-dependent zinc metalloprotease FTSHI 5, chloroplastic n=1 Tax=Mercurialis annua TaxID=3986 RepID=UPI00215F62BE|nr:probable inactive ATP-dependent zinc metalloprotease FTSHI 5, chloroplastic [Mercurialis annua]